MDVGAGVKGDIKTWVGSHQNICILIFWMFPSGLVEPIIQRKLFYRHWIYQQWCLIKRKRDMTVEFQN